MKFRIRISQLITEISDTQRNLNQIRKSDTVWQDMIKSNIIFLYKKSIKAF